MTIKRDNLERILATGILIVGLPVTILFQDRIFSKQIKDINDIDLHEEKMFSEYTSVEKAVMAKYGLTDKKTYTNYMENKFDIQPMSL